MDSPDVSFQGPEVAPKREEESATLPRAVKPWCAGAIGWRENADELGQAALGRGNLKDPSRTFT